MYFQRTLFWQKKKFATQIDEKVFKDLKEYTQQTDRNISSVVNEAVTEYLKRVQVRPAFKNAMAALLQSLTQNHAFVDGNKRVAFATTAIFLRMNNYRLVVDPDNGESFLINEVIENKADIKIFSS